MARRHHYRRKKETPELELTTFLNLMVVLISFLLVTAVFSRITIQELRLPTAGGGASVGKPLVTIEVILRKNDISYQDVIRVMDAVKTARVRQTGQEQIEKIELFPDVSVGDAP
jgi:biopolymer transport protein ExbD